MLVGGVAAVVHGSSQFTKDLDVLAEFSVENLARLQRVLRPLNPRFAIGDHVPFPTGAEVLSGFKNLDIQTDWGRLDVLGDSPPLPPFAELSPRSVDVVAFGITLKVVPVDDLIAVKERVARPNDLVVVQELRAAKALRGRA